MYHFRFESVLRYRKQLQDQIQRDLAVLQKQVMVEYSKLKVLEETRQEAMQTLQERQRQGLTLRELGLYDAYLERLCWERDRQREALHLLNQSAEDKRRQLLEAAKKKKILEKLKDRERTQYIQEERRLERLQNDEIAVTKIARAMSLRQSYEQQEEVAPVESVPWESARLGEAP